MARGIIAGVIGLVSVLAAAACGGTASAPDVVSGAPVVVADVIPAPAQTVATHVKLGFAFTANLLGELEPCG